MSGSTPCPLCGSATGPGDQHCGVCGLSMREVSDTNAGGSKCARCGSAMPSGFDFCPVCGQDQRERWRRPPTQSLRINPMRSADLGQSAVPPPPMTTGSPAMTVASPGYGQPPMAPTPVQSIDRTVPSPDYAHAPVHSRKSMPPILSAHVADEDHTMPEGAGGPRQSFEDAAFGSSPSSPGLSPAPSPRGPAPASPPAAPHAQAEIDLENSKTIPFITLQKRQLEAGGAGLTIPAMFMNQPTGPKPLEATKPDRPGGFSGGPTGEAPPAGVNTAHPQLSHQSQTPTYPGARPARLVLVSRDGTEGENFPFSGDTLTVGRTHGDILFPEDPFLSPVHVRLSRTGHGILLTDAGSTNGVYMRIAKVAPVYPGDMFMIGHQLLRLDQLDSQAQEHPPGVDGTRLFGTPLQPAWGRVTQLGRGGVAGDHMYLRGSRVSFGREGGDLVFPNDPFVSREHARLRLEITGQAMAVFLEDLGSANGTYVRIRGAAEISSGDTFRVGDQILKLKLD